MQHNVLPHEHPHAHAREVKAVQKLPVGERILVRENILVGEHIYIQSKLSIIITFFLILFVNCCIKDDVVLFSKWFVLDYYNTSVFGIFRREITCKRGLINIIGVALVSIGNLRSSCFSSKGVKAIKHTLPCSWQYNSFQAWLKLQQGWLAADRIAKNCGFEFLHYLTIFHDSIDQVRLQHFSIVSDGIVHHQGLQRTDGNIVAKAHPRQCNITPVSSAWIGDDGVWFTNLHLRVGDRHQISRSKLAKLCACVNF